MAGGGGIPPGSTESDIKRLYPYLTRISTEDWAKCMSDEVLVDLGYLAITRLLDPMLEQGRWLDAAAYLGRVFRFHEEAATAAAVHGAPPGDIRLAHPELYILPRQQLGLELATSDHQPGGRQEAQPYYNDLVVVVASVSAQNAKHGDHVDDMMHLFRCAMAGGEITRKRVAIERERTCGAIRDYLHLYLPKASGWVETLERQKQQVVSADVDWQLGERLGPREFRCLACHMAYKGTLYNLRCHITTCKAATKSIKGRLIRPPPDKKGNKGKRGDDADDDKAGPGSSSSHGHGRGGGSAGAAAGATDAAA